MGVNMIEPPKNITSEQLFLFFGFISAILSSLVRLMKNKANFTSFYCVTRSVVDALTCALLSYGIFLILHQYWDISTSSIIFIGTFVGSLGSTTIITLASTALKKWVSSNENNQR
nr:MAG TPA: holin [Caudoviricetes sp.]